MEVNQLTEVICKALSDKKAKNIVIVDIAHLTIVADNFIICSGGSTTQVKALANNLDEILSKDYGIEPLRMEGKTEGKWAVVDYGGVIVHIFLEEVRNLYSLEQLWSDGVNVKTYED